MIRLWAICVAMLASSMVSHATLEGVKASAQQQALTHLFEQQNLQNNDAILVMRDAQVLYQWQGDKPLIPASLVKIITAQLAIEHWGLTHRFVTDFYLADEHLWVKGLGDPFLISEEIDRLVTALQPILPAHLKTIALDNSFYNITTPVPWRSKVNDPYNAPVSAIAANFNTAKLQKVGGKFISAEPQTPLTDTAKRVAALSQFGAKAQRVNLRNADNAQRNFAEVLRHKLGRPALQIQINQALPSDATRLYQHRNHHTLADLLRGTLEYSNNFIANQLFLNLSGADSASFAQAQQDTQARLAEQYQWANHRLQDGAGLSRNNQLSAQHIQQVLQDFAPHKTLLKSYQAGDAQAAVRAKTGTLNGVRTYAGYLEIDQQNYTFVFLFNRHTPWRYREQLLDKLADQLAQ